MIKAKICGIQNQKDINAASGADAVGFVVSTPESSRNVTPNTAARLVDEVPPFTCTVLVTTEAEPGKLGPLAREVGPDYVQLHSKLSLNRIEEIRKSIPDPQGLIALITMAGKKRDLRIRAINLAKSPADAVLLDSNSGDRPGGTGKTHDWKLSRMIRDAVHPFPVILAGGLDPGNVREAGETVKPYAVDAASGLEVAGEKSSEKTSLFIQEVNKSAT